MKLYIAPHVLLRYWWLTRSRYNGATQRDEDGRWRDLPGEWPRPNPAGIFFTACDAEYFRLYGENYVRSIAASGGDQSVHLHIYDADAAMVRRASEYGCRSGIAVTVTRDATCDVSLYSEYLFAAGRFMILPRLLAAAGSPVICTDIDVLVRRSLNDSIVALRGEDVSLHLRPKSSLPWRKVLASTVIAMPTRGAQHFFDTVADALQDVLAKPLTHHVDQMFLYLAYRQARVDRSLPVRFACMSQSLIDWEFEERSLIWNAKGPERKAAYWEAARGLGQGSRALSVEA